MKLNIHERGLCPPLPTKVTEIEAFALFVMFIDLQYTGAEM